MDLVIPEENWEQKRTDVKEYHVDTFVMGDDWKGKFDFLKEEGCEVIYLPRTPEISSTQIKNDLNMKKENDNRLVNKMILPQMGNTIPGGSLFFAGKCSFLPQTLTFVKISL